MFFRRRLSLRRFTGGVMALGLGLLTLALGGCSTTRHWEQPTATAAARSLQEGDRIRLELKDGRRYRAVVVAVTEAELVTRHSRYAFDDIARIERKSLSAGKTLLLVLAIVFLAGEMMEEFMEDFAEALASP